MRMDDSDDPDGDPDQEDEDEDDEDVGKDESAEYDPFAAETFDDPNMQKCWLILGKLFYHYEVTDFLDPITEDILGEEMYQEYCSVVAEPMDINSVMTKMRTRSYMSKEAFRRDVDLIFDNCREFNEAGTEIVHCANSLTIEFEGLW